MLAVVVRCTRRGGMRKTGVPLTTVSQDAVTAKTPTSAHSKSRAKVEMGREY